MKKINKFLILILFWCLNLLLVNAQTIQPVERSIGKLNISIDPRQELLSTVQLLSHYPRGNRDLPYSKEKINYFKSFSSQEAVAMTDSLAQKYIFTDDAPITFMLYLSQPPELEQQIPFTDYLKKRSGGGDNMEQYRKALEQFAEASNFKTFWNSRIPFYNQILDSTIAEMGGRNLLNDVEEYFNEPKEGYNIIIMPSYTGGTGPSITDANGKVILYSCVGANNMKDNIPYLDKNYLLGLVWHEFSHSFVNPETSKQLDRVNSASEDKLYEPIKSYMLKQGYINWETGVNEHIVRAVNVRLHELHLGAEAGKASIKDELNQGFIYIEPLVEKLKDFEVQRTQNRITFSEYYPQLLDVLDSLQKVEYWKKFNLNVNFGGNIIDAVDRVNLAIIYPTNDSDTTALKIAQEQALKVYNMFTQYIKAGMSLSLLSLADTVALKTDLSDYGIMAYGTIESNLFLKRYASTFPFKIENQTIYADKEYTDKNLKFISSVPSPLNPTKGMSIHTALSNSALQGIDDAFFANNFAFLSNDYILFLNQDTVLSKGYYKKDGKWAF